MNNLRRLWRSKKQVGGYDKQAQQHDWQIKSLKMGIQSKS
jgi:hypothetical protein